MLNIVQIHPKLHALLFKSKPLVELVNFWTSGPTCGNEFVASGFFCRKHDLPNEPAPETITSSGFVNVYVLHQPKWNGVEVGPIVGVFSDGGDYLESLLVGDVDSVMTAWKRPNYDLVLVRLNNASDFDSFKHWLTSNPAISVDAVREPDWYQQMASHRTPFFAAMAYLVGAIMAVGALIGGMRIMYAAVSSRIREIVTLRAIGYEAFPVAVSVVGGMRRAVRVWRGRRRVGRLADL